MDFRFSLRIFPIFFAIYLWNRSRYGGGHERLPLFMDSPSIIVFDNQINTIKITKFENKCSSLRSQCCKMRLFEVFEGFSKNSPSIVVFDNQINTRKIAKFENICSSLRSQCCKMRLFKRFSHSVIGVRKMVD